MFLQQHDQAVKLYVKPRDSTTGEVEFMARQKAVDSSRKIIIVLSNSYICSASCLEDATILLGTVDNCSYILPVIYTNVITYIVMSYRTEDDVDPDLPA